MFRLEVHLHGLPQRKGTGRTAKGDERALGHGRVWGGLHANVALVLRVPHRPALSILAEEGAVSSGAPASGSRLALRPAAPPPRLQVASFSCNFKKRKAIWAACARSPRRSVLPGLLSELLGRVLRRLRFATHVGRGAEGVGALLAFRAARVAGTPRARWSRESRRKSGLDVWRERERERERLKDSETLESRKL